MSRTSSGSFARQTLRQCALVCFAVCVVFSLAPCADFDLDGSFDSFATDGFLMNASVPGIELPALLLRQPVPNRFCPAEPFAASIPHPPTH